MASPFLFYFLCLFFAFPSWAKRTWVENEWIGVHVSKEPQWKGLLSPFHQLQFLENFGPGNRVVRVREKIGKPPPKILGVKWQRNFIYRSLGDPDLEKSWGLENTGKNTGLAPDGVAGADISAVKVWALPPKSCLVAVLDSGIDLSHEDLTQSVWKNENLSKKSLIKKTRTIDDGAGWNFVDDNNRIQDDNGHGTMVAGILSADANNGKGTRGVTSGKLLVVKVLDAKGTTTTERAVKAIRYAIQKEAKILNASWGGLLYDKALYETIKWAGEQGVLFITAAGNSAKNNDTDPDPVYPASFSLPNIVSVAAYNHRDELAPFSNYGRGTVDIGAPGEDIYSTVSGGGYKFGSGTSFAAPFVAGAASLLWGNEPSLTAIEVKDRLLKTSVPISYYSRYQTRSGGRVNAYHAVLNIIPEPAKIPVTWQSHQTLKATEHPYPVRVNESYVIRSPGATHIRVHFSRFDLENGFDTVTLKDSLGRVVDRYTGSLESFTSADALGDTLKIEFVSDYSVTQWGFEVDQYEVSFEP